MSITVPVSEYSKKYKALSLYLRRYHKIARKIVLK